MVSISRILTLLTSLAISNATCNTRGFGPAGIDMFVPINHYYILNVGSKQDLSNRLKLISKLNLFSFFSCEHFGKLIFHLNICQAINIRYTYSKQHRISDLNNSNNAEQFFVLRSRYNICHSLYNFKGSS